MVRVLLLLILPLCDVKGFDGNGVVNYSQVRVRVSKTRYRMAGTHPIIVVDVRRSHMTHTLSSIKNRFMKHV